MHKRTQTAPGMQAIACPKSPGEDGVFFVQLFFENFMEKVLKMQQPRRSLFPTEATREYHLSPQYDALKTIRLHVQEGPAFRDHPGISGAESHGQNEILSIQKGRGTLRTAEQTYVFDAGDIFLFSSNEAYELIPRNARESVSSVAILFDISFIMNPGTSLIDKGYADLFLSRKRGLNKLDPGSKYMDEIKRNITEITNMFMMQAEGAPLLMKGKLLCILAIMYMHFDLVGEDVPERMDRRNYQIIEKSRRYIHENLDSALSIPEIARRFQISERYYVILFKKIYGTTPKKYILEQRLNQAVALLMENESNMLEISFLCGFNSNAYFCKCFKERFQVTPSAFRGQLQAAHP